MQNINKEKLYEDIKIILGAQYYSELSPEQQTLLEDSTIFDTNWANLLKKTVSRPTHPHVEATIHAEYEGLNSDYINKYRELKTKYGN